MGELAAASVQFALFGLVTGSIAFAKGAATGRRATAVSVASAVTVLGCLANGVFPQFEPLRWTRDISPWHWFVGGKGKHLAAHEKGQPPVVIMQFATCYEVS